MAQQIKKKYLSSEVISYFDDQIDSVESSVTQEIADRISGDASTLSGANSYTDIEVAAEASLRISGDAASVSSANAYTDSEVAAEAALRVSGDAASVSSSNAYTDSQIALVQGDIDTEKGRIDAILLAADADKDSFAEIVTLINSIDTANDSAFAGYVISNNAAVAALDGRLDTAESEIDTLQTQSADHESRITSLETAMVPIWAPAFKKDLTATDITNGYVDLAHEAISGSVMAFVDRLAIHETEEFTVSVVGGVTRVTFAGPLVSPGNQSLDANDNVFFKYQYLA